MPRKPALLLSLLNLVLKPIAGQTKASSKQLVALPQHPPAHDCEAWRAYWAAQGQPWRTESEIDAKRQKYLAGRRAILPDIEHGIYPFKDIKLNRADVEWLLSTHEHGRGPVYWSDESQRRRSRIDLRGADLRRVDLRDLPLARLLGGLSWEERKKASEEQRMMAAVLMQGANLFRAHLENAILHDAHLEDAHLDQVSLEDAYLRGAHLERAILIVAHLNGAHLRGAYLQDATLRDAYLGGARLEDAILGNAQHAGPLVADVQWNDTNLAVVNWSQIRILGDEYIAQQKISDGKRKDKATRLDEYRAAVRANRQLATALQAQGLNEDAARFAYRAQVLQKRVFWFQMFQKGAKPRQRAQALGAWLFSWFLYLLAGYGYRLGRSFLAYLLIIGLFMTLYHVLDPHLAWNEAFVVSMTAFHGRGFSPSTFVPSDPLSLASAAEAFVGLIIEVTFIATLTQRFFNR